MNIYISLLCFTSSLIAMELDLRPQRTIDDRVTHDDTLWSSDGGYCIPKYSGAIEEISSGIRYKVPAASEITATCWSPQAPSVALSTKKGMLHIWNSINKEWQEILAGKEKPDSDDAHIAAAAGVLSFLFTNAYTQNTIRSIDSGLETAASSLSGFPSEVEQLKWSSTSEFIATKSRRDGYIKIWNTTTGTLWLEIPIDKTTEDVSFNFSHNAQHCAVCFGTYRRKILSIWNIATKTLVQEIELDFYPKSLFWTANDSSIIVKSSWNNKIYYLDPADNKTYVHYMDPSYKIPADFLIVSCNPQGTYLLGVYERTIAFYDVENKIINHLKAGIPDNWSPNGELAVCGNSHIYDLKNNRSLLYLPSESHKFWSSNSRYLVISKEDTFDIYDVQDRRYVKKAIMGSVSDLNHTTHEIIARYYGSPRFMVIHKFAKKIIDGGRQLLQEILDSLPGNQKIPAVIGLTMATYLLFGIPLYILNKSRPVINLLLNIDHHIAVYNIHGEAIFFLPHIYSAQWNPHAGNYLLTNKLRDKNYGVHSWPPSEAVIEKARSNLMRERLILASIPLAIFLYYWSQNN